MLTPHQERLIARRPDLEARIRGEGLAVASQGPGLLQSAINYTKAQYRYIAKGGFKLSLELAEERYVICRSCEYYDSTLDRCKHRRCGCVVAEKVTWSTESCPLTPSRWAPYAKPIDNS